MRRNWTIEEVTYLEENVGKFQVSTIARNLNRSEQSVLLKMKRLGIANTKAQFGLITVGELSKLLKIERNIVCGWVRNHGLKCIQKSTRSSKKFWFVNPMDFWSWAEQNKRKIDFSKIEPHSIPPEPEWLKVERSKTKEESIYKSWTTKEIKDLLHLISLGKSYEDVAKKLSRTTTSVERKYTRSRKYG
ncbi:hypothetical protein [Halalkalibacter hemicellulosilyticus]|uniref:Uncharacterized protein n=1 Tax=Halalkalibacter hemicellulosilyticusJCM 9152 TaxID=1236971 RepID=W4QGR7_9BACI|nr:hypothetical protein [Halalkalibacter hemicellulosilyticus]GAE30514.1 hypothetical protein JCM9152_1922 [Halalkalibacter hemicellulosilyticusJCM 9152]